VGKIALACLISLALLATGLSLIGSICVAKISFHRYFPNVVKPVAERARTIVLAGCVAFGTFAASGLAPHLGQATTTFLRS
jgi:hypothetical protein